MKEHLDVRPGDTADSLLERLEERRNRAERLRRQRWSDIKDFVNVAGPLFLIWAGVNVLIYLITAALYFNMQPNGTVHGMALLTTLRPAWLVFQGTVNVIVLAGAWLGGR